MNSGESVLKRFSGRLAVKFDAKRPGMPVPVDPKELVTELIVGPDVPDWVLQLLVSVSLRYGLSAPIRWSNLKER